MMKHFFAALILIFCLSCSNTKTDFINISENWSFKIDETKTGINQEWFKSINIPNETQQLKHPGNWEALTRDNYDGWGWYFKKFEFHKDFDKTAIHFLSVDDNAYVWLNGEKVGDHFGANCAFKMDVTPFIKKGRNFLAVLIEDTGGGGGLNGQVELISFNSKEDLLKGKYSDMSAPTHPQWAKNAVIYELNTRQFTPEGTFNAIENRIPELKNLGVSIIWFMPIHPIGVKRRKGSLGSYYSVRDFYGINPEFGTLDDFKRLVKKMHEAGLYVIIDLVANHTAWDNPLIESHPDWYTRDENGNMIPPVHDWSDVVDLNYDNPGLCNYMIEMMKFWVRDIGIDGYRCDVAAMVPTEFWIQARKELEKIKPVFMLAEAEDPELNAFGFDMTYASKLHHIFNRISKNRATPMDIDKALKHEQYFYPKNSMRMRFTSNHDENSWNLSAVSRMGREAAKAGAVLTFTLPGTPLIYNGQEVGNSKSLEFFERDPIAWEENEFRGLYTTLARVYRDNPALHEGNIVKLTSEKNNQVYAFTRNSEDETVIVVVNLSSESFHGSVNLLEIRGTFYDIFTDRKIVLNSPNLKVNLSPWGYLILSR